MKEFVNRTESENSDFTTAGLLKVILTSPGSANGLSLEELRTRIKLMDEIEKPGDHIQLEDALHRSLVKILEEFRFGMVSRELLQVVDDVTGATKVAEPSVKTPAKKAN